MLYFYKIPWILKKIFPNYIWEMLADNKNIYLTFDDGPTPEVTEWVLDILKKYNAKATFFCEGQNVERYPGIVKKILLEEHIIGNHSYSHLNGWFTKTKDYLSDVKKADKVLFPVVTLNALDCSANKGLLLFRPPFGKIRPKQAKELRKIGYKIVMLDVVSGDFDTTITPQISLKKTIKNTKPGSIVVFHDNKKAFKSLKYTLPRTLEFWSKQGYEFLTLENCKN